MLKAGVIAALALMPFAVQAQTVCLPMGEAVAGMKEKGSFPVFGGYTGRSVMQVWMNPESDAWMIIDVRPNGVGCILFSGSIPRTYEPPKGAAF